MLVDVTNVKAVGGHRIHVRFNDGAEGEIDLAEHISFTGVFEPHRDPTFFAKVFVHPEFRVICWPNDTDFDSVSLYSLVTKQPIEAILAAQSARERRASAA